MEKTICRSVSIFYGVFAVLSTVVGCTEKSPIPSPLRFGARSSRTFQKLFRLEKTIFVDLHEPSAIYSHNRVSYLLIIICYQWFLHCGAHHHSFWFYSLIWTEIFQQISCLIIYKMPDDFSWKKTFFTFYLTPRAVFRPGGCVCIFFYIFRLFYGRIEIFVFSFIRILHFPKLLNVFLRTPLTYHYSIAKVSSTLGDNECLSITIISVQTNL